MRPAVLRDEQYSPVCFSCALADPIHPFVPVHPPDVCAECGRQDMVISPGAIELANEAGLVFGRQVLEWMIAGEVARLREQARQNPINPAIAEAMQWAERQTVLRAVQRGPWGVWQRALNGPGGWATDETFATFEKGEEWIAIGFGHLPYERKSYVIVPYAPVPPSLPEPG